MQVNLSYYGVIYFFELKKKSIFCKKKKNQNCNEFQSLRDCTSFLDIHYGICMKQRCTERMSYIIHQPVSQSRISGHGLLFLSFGSADFLCLCIYKRLELGFRKESSFWNLYLIK